jgi:hypothetical protein
MGGGSERVCRDAGMFRALSIATFRLPFLLIFILLTELKPSSPFPALFATDDALTR